MAQQRVEEQRNRDMYELGARNAALIPRIERWCQHLQIKLLSSGLLAQMSGLPIGHMGITCLHAKGTGIQAMQLDQVAACFITENCRGCPHHRELNPDNAGREILREADRIEEEEKKPRAAAAPTARRLDGLVTGDLSQALATAPTTEQSVLECVARLKIPTQADEAAKLLVQAADLAPEFFSDVACEIIAEHFPDLGHGGTCAEAMRVLGRKRGAIPPVGIRAALRCAEDQLCDDSILELLADHYERDSELPSVPTIARFVRQHGYREVGITLRKPKSRSGQVRALLAIGRRDPDRIADAINRLLEEPRPQIRIAAPVAISALLPKMPALGLAVLDRLIRSLELDDNDRFDISTDVHACDAIGEIFTFHPQETRGRLDAFAVVASEEGQELLIKVYERLNRDAAPKEIGPEHDRARAALPHALDALLPVLTNTKRLLSVREAAAETLSHMAWNHPALLVERLDGLFGALALVVQEHVKFQEKNPGGDPQLRGFPRLENIKYDHIANKLFSALEKLAAHDAEHVFESTVQMLSSLKSKDPAHEHLRWHLVGLFERLSRDHTVGPRVAPPLYHALMDVESVMVRARALSVIEDMLGARDELIPDNMRDMVVIYLRDPYKGIHQAAAKAMRHFEPETPEQALEIVRWLGVQYGVYFNEREDHPHLEALAEASARVCRRYPQFLVYATPLIVRQAQSKNDHTAREALEEWRRSLPSNPTLNQRYVKETLAHFKRCPPEANEWRAYNPAHRIFLTLFECETAAIVANLAEFQNTITALTKTAPYEALQFLSVLLHHEQYAATVEGAETIAKTLPPEASNDWARGQARLTKAAAQAEMLVASAKAKEAIAVLIAEEPRLKPDVPDENRNDTGALIRSLSLAGKVAARLRRV